MKYQELIIQVNQGKIKPIYFFHGEEKFLIEEAIVKLKKVLLPDGVEVLNYHHFSGPATRAEDIVHACQTLPLLAIRRLVLVRDIEGLSGSERLDPYLNTPSDSTCLVLVANKVDQRKRLFSILKTKGMEVQFSTLRDTEVRSWIKEMARTMGIVLSPGAVDYLLDRLGNDLFHIRSELEKVALTSLGGHVLEPEDIQALLTGDHSHSVFEWLDAIRMCDRETAIRLLTPLLDAGEYPLSLLGLLLSHLRRLAKTIDQPGQGRPVGYLSKNKGTALRLDVPDLIRAFKLCLETDSKLKGSRLSPQIILEELILDLCRKDKNKQTSGLRRQNSMAPVA